MNKIYKTLSEKIPPINESVFIMNESINKIYRAKLIIFDTEKDKLSFKTVKALKKNDIFWRVGMIEGTSWASIEEWPYWMEIEDLINLVTNGVSLKPEDASRFEILDL